MSYSSIFIVCLLSFIVSIFSVSVGGTSLITVPALISFGMISKNAVATNMVALIFLSISGALGFRRKIKISHYKVIVLFSILTICGSLIGASFVLAIDKDILKKVIGIIIFIIAGSVILKKDLGLQEKRENISKIKFVSSALLIFILGIYGGFFSGGYVTFLSYILIVTLNLNFLQVAYITKIFNIFSSLVASTFFYYHGLVDFSVAIPLGLSMALGATLGTRLAVLKGNLWIRNLFIIVILLLAIKLLFF
ncbi:MAG: sulfite exporter TauE/SafE family protein [Candidatus Aminicenantaceae bacterium]